MDMKTYYLRTVVYRNDVKLKAGNLKEARKEVLVILKEYISTNNPDFNSVEFTRLLGSLKRNAVITRVTDDKDGGQSYYSWYYIDYYNR